MSYPPEHSDAEYAAVTRRAEAAEYDWQAAVTDSVRLRGIVRAQARFLRWIAANYKGVDLDIVRARANELDALAARGEAS